MLRGTDGAGIFQTDRTGKIFLHKEAVEGSFFSLDKQTRAFIEDTCRSAATVTHTRAATQGEILDENTHPFVVNKPNGEPLVGCHNGSLTGWKAKPGAKEFNVDSKWALHHIATLGHDAFKDINGPYCFVWVEADIKNKLFMTRNSQRPMHLLFSKDRRSMLFASEAGMLSWLATRNNITCEDDILVLLPDRIYEFDMSGNTVRYTSKPTPRTTYEYKTPVTDLRPNRQPWKPASTAGNGLNADGYNFIHRIKQAVDGKFPDVKEDKKSTNTLPAIIDEKVIDKTLQSIIGEVEEDIASQGDDGDAFDTDLVPASWFSERSTKHAERALAIQTGFFRELHWFTGVAFDDDSHELLGDVEIWDSKNGKTTYTGVMRNISPARAQAEYIDNAKPPMSAGGWAVITGQRPDKILGTVFIMTELNQTGRAAMIDQRKKAN